MNLSNEFQSIRDWALDKRIIQDGTLEKQYTKFQEEAGELAKAILKNDEKELIDAIGDIVVTLVSVAGIASKHFAQERNNLPNSITIESCINAAYEVIKNRTGTIVNGDFHKDETRECDDCLGIGVSDIGVGKCLTCDGTGQIKQ